MGSIIKSIDMLNEPAKSACRLFLDICKERKIDIFITETFRTPDRQKNLFEKGASKCDGIKNKSAHQGGLAWDVACKGSELYSHSILNRAGAVARELNITWGGTWADFVDKPHFEVGKNWKPPSRGNLNKKTICINGFRKEVECIEKNGNNFIKIRDLESPTIKIGYDSKNKIITIDC